MKHGSLFSGIGGFDLAAEWARIETVFQVEIDEFCNKVLEKNFPNVKRYKDIFDFKDEETEKCKGTVDIISGGFPCQPFSNASQTGKRKGEKDDRFVWPEMLRVVREIKPSYVIGENVFGLYTMDNGKTLERILLGLEAEGYICESFIIPACAVGTWHRRDRIWIVAYNNGNRTIKIEIEEKINNKTLRKNTSRRFHFADFHKNITTTIRNYATVYGKLYGIPDWVDRIKSLGNAIVPQVAYEIFEIIKEFDRGKNYI